MSYNVLEYIVRNENTGRETIHRANTLRVLKHGVSIPFPINTDTNDPKDPNKQYESKLDVDAIAKAKEKQIEFEKKEPPRELKPGDLVEWRTFNSVAR
jgi:hypothetical protein